MSIQCSINKQQEILDAVGFYFIENNFASKVNIEVNLAELNSFVGEETGITNFNLGHYLSVPGFSNRLLEVLNENFAEWPSELKQIETLATKSNVGKNFSTLAITDMFHSSSLSWKYFEGKTNEKMIKHVLLGDSKAKNYIGNDSELSISLNSLKNQLFRDIQTFLKDKGILTDEISDLYLEDGVVKDYGYYKKVISLLDNYFFKGSFEMLTSSDGKQIPILPKNINKNSAIYDAYNAGIFLTNFDSVMVSLYPTLIKVNYNQFNDLSSGIGATDKYSLKVKGLTTIYWSNDDHMADSSENTEGKLTNMLISAIPVYNKKGEKTDSYLNMKNFYLFAAKVSNFELAHGNYLKNKALKNPSDNSFIYFNEDSITALNWYLNEITLAMEGKSPDLKTASALIANFGENYEFVISLKKFLEDPQNNIAEKEENSQTSLKHLLTQVINNNFGSSYFKYDASGNIVLQEIYKQNFNNTKVQNTTLGKLVENSENTGTYNLDIDETKAEFNNLFEGLSLDSPIKNISREHKEKIAKYLSDKTGITLSIASFNDVISDLERVNDTDKNITVQGFKSRLQDLMRSMYSDITSEHFKDLVGNPNFRKSNADSTVGEYLYNTVKRPLYIATRNAYLMNFIVMPMMYIETLSGEKLPTFKLGNLTYKDTEIFELQRKFENENKQNKFRSLLIQDNPVILGTGTKLEATNADVNKGAVKFSVSESYISDFQFEFLKNIIKNDSFSIIIGNYSDKNTVLTKLISGKHKVGNAQNTVLKSKLDEEGGALNTMRTQAWQFYKDALNNVFSDYKTILDRLGIANSINIDNFENNFNSNVKEVNRILETNNVRDLVFKYNDSKPEKTVVITDELHFSKYGSKTAMNQMLVDNYRIFSNDNNFNEFVKRQEKSLVDKFREFNKRLPNGENDLNLGDRFSETDLKQILESLGLTDADFPSVDGKPNYTILYNDTTEELNPLIRKWLWTNALYRNEYLFVTGKGEYMHPHKIKDFDFRGDTEGIDFDAYSKEMSGRLSSMAKRNVIYTSTFEAPVRQSELGIPDQINHAVIEDSPAYLFNISGDIKKNQDAFDGSSFMEAIYSMMLDKSYPQKGYEGTKKQFGTLITPHGVTIKKDAESVITNDKILKSKNSKVSFLNKKKQMLSQDISDVMMDLNLEFSDGAFNYNYLGKIHSIYNFKINGNSYEL